MFAEIWHWYGHSIGVFVFNIVWDRILEMHTDGARVGSQFISADE